MVSQLPRSNGVARTLFAFEQGEEPVGLEQGHRHRQVPRVLVDLGAPVLALALEGLQRRHHAGHELHDDRGVDVRVHAQRHDREVGQAAAREQVEQPEDRAVVQEVAELGTVDARHRHVGQEPEDEQDPGDEQDPAPEVRRAERIEQGLEHVRLAVVGEVGRRLDAEGGERRGRDLDHLGRAAGRLDLRAGALREGVRQHEQLRVDLAVAEDLEREPVAPDQAGRLQGIGVDRDRRALLLVQPARGDGGADGADVDDLVLDVVDVAEAAQLRDPDVERRLAALEPGGDRRPGSRLLALGPAARGLALAGGDAAADPGAPGDRPLGGVEVVDLHRLVSGVVASAPSASSSKVTRNRTWRTMPRTAGLSGRIEELPMPWRPRARIVARFRAMWLIVLLVWVTRSLAAIGHLLRGSRLAGHDEAELHAALAGQLLDGPEAGERVERRPGDVHRVGGPVDLGQDVADPRRLDDGADGAAGDDAGPLGGRLEQHPRGGILLADLVRDRGPDHRDAHDVLLGILDALADGLGHVTGLAQADADVAVAVAHDDHRREREAPAALVHLGDAIDLDDALLERELVGVDAGHRVSSQKSRPASRAASASERTRPWYWKPARSKTTLSTPAAFARSATSWPTRLASATFVPSAPRRSASSEDAAARVRPLASSMTWA